MTLPYHGCLARANTARSNDHPSTVNQHLFGLYQGFLKSTSRSCRYPNYAYHLADSIFEGPVQNFSHQLKGAIKHLLGKGFDTCPNPIESGNLRAVCHDHWPNDPTLIAAWNRLCAACPTATTFHSPLWQQAVVETFAKEDRLRLITVHQANRLVAV